MHSDERFRQVMDTVSVLIWCSDADGNVEYVNKVWREFTGDPGRDIGRSWVARVHPEDAPRVVAQVAKNYAEREPIRLELRLRRWDGVWRWALCSGVPRTDPDGEFAGYFGSCTDITRAKEAQAQRQRDAEEKAAVMQELHHRVKNNAQVFASLLSVQASRASDPAVKAALRVAAARAATMAFAQQQIWDAGSSARFDLGGLVRRLVRAQPVRDVTVEVEAPSKLFVPLATAVPLGLIVHELLTNALDHGFPQGGQGRVDIKLGRDRCGLLHLVIGDDGVGMRPSERGSGQSAGLTIVRSLVRQLGATMTTEVGPGTTVRISLPCPPPG